MAPPLPPAVAVGLVWAAWNVVRTQTFLAPGLPLCRAGQVEGPREGQGLLKRQELVHRRGGARGCLCLCLCLCLCRRVRRVVVVGDDPLGDGLVKVGERVGAVDHLDE